jgi:RHS repeat-associated protein
MRTADRLTTMVDSAGTTVYRYANGLLASENGPWAYDKVICAYNTASQRTRQTRLAGDYVDYTYDAAGQLKTALGKESGGATNRQAEQLGYVYDAGGSLQYRTNNALVQSFSVDNVNQPTHVARTGTLTVAGGTSATATGVFVKDNGNSAVGATLHADNTFARSGVALLDGTNTFTAVAIDSSVRGDTNAVTVTLPASVTYTHDDNGNLTSDGQQSFGHDGENQLVAVQVAGSWRSEFRYDGKLRRRVRVEKVWLNSQWVTASEARYVYDGMLVIQERDANNLPAASYTRGCDLSGICEGAGAIGGLLARTDNQLLVAGDPLAHACYHADGNGNITALSNSAQGIVARYLHDPYGNLLAKVWSLAATNLYRFSSKEPHAASGPYYYGYRFYAPNLQRWVNSDPVAEKGCMNLCAFVRNGREARSDLARNVHRCIIAHGETDEHRERAADLFAIYK